MLPGITLHHPHDRYVVDQDIMEGALISSHSKSPCLRPRNTRGLPFASPHVVMVPALPAKRSRPEAIGIGNPMAPNGSVIIVVPVLEVSWKKEWRTI